MVRVILRSVAWDLEGWRCCLLQGGRLHYTRFAWGSSGGGFGRKLEIPSSHLRGDSWRMAGCKGLEYREKSGLTTGRREL